MPFAHFYNYFPEVAKGETHSITISPASEFGLPPDDYGFLEMYCDEPGCDCRRVLILCDCTISNGRASGDRLGMGGRGFLRPMDKTR